MRITNLFLTSVLAAAVLSLSTLAAAESSVEQRHAVQPPAEKMQPMDHSQHAAHEHGQMMQQANQAKTAEKAEQANSDKDQTAAKGDHHAHH
ncbi:hypothetical protein [Acinetobacter pragensis]|uniref:Copper resistance protein CopB n=1 Tax=Acinetobacter pragensis TaxID=1806892 RepID=A0A151Y0S8_9GAMM|nr:hypothetical protein [Acinetobacter pragensis]KYQ71646.1 hypothetical protein AZH43_01995 [Acinetobacter pragensis]